MHFHDKQDQIDTVEKCLRSTWVRVKHNDYLDGLLDVALQQDCTSYDLLKRPEIHYAHLQAISDLALPAVADAIAEQLEIQCKYAGYIARQTLEIERLQKHEAMRLPQRFDYQCITGLSSEVVQKLNHVQPVTLAQAGRISGVTPAALSLLLIYLKKHPWLHAAVSTHDE